MSWWQIASAALAGAGGAVGCWLSYRIGYARGIRYGATSLMQQLTVIMRRADAEFIRAAEQHHRAMYGAPEQPKREQEIN